MQDERHQSALLLICLTGVLVTNSVSVTSRGLSLSETYHLHNWSGMNLAKWYIWNTKWMKDRLHSYSKKRSDSHERAEMKGCTLHRTRFTESRREEGRFDTDVLWVVRHPCFGVRLTCLLFCDLMQQIIRGKLHPWPLILKGWNQKTGFSFSYSVHFLMYGHASHAVWKCSICRWCDVVSLLPWNICNIVQSEWKVLTKLLIQWKKKIYERTRFFSDCKVGQLNTFVRELQFEKKLNTICLIC